MGVASIPLVEYFYQKRSFWGPPTFWGGKGTNLDRTSLMKIF